MSVDFVYIWMLMMHVVADFNIQRNLADYKQRSWWEKNYPQKKYKNDYMMAGWIHALEWTFLVMLPIACYYKFNINSFFIVVFFINVAIHSLIDDLKANDGLLSLTQDQCLHFAQILITLIVLIK